VRSSKDGLALLISHGMFLKHNGQYSIYQLVAELEGLGAEVRAGDFDDVSSIQRAAQGVDAMFAVATPYSGTDVETQHGINLANAAKAAGVLSTALCQTLLGIQASPTSIASTR